MKDRLGNVADMLMSARELRNKAPIGSEEYHYFQRECYKWENELMANNVNPSDIHSFDFMMAHNNGFR